LLACVYAGANPIADRIICLDDALFGSAVTGFTLNEAAQLAIRVSLADGRPNDRTQQPPRFQPTRQRR